MKKSLLLKRIKEITNEDLDLRSDVRQIDALLVKFINDKDITDAFNKYINRKYYGVKEEMR